MGFCNYKRQARGTYLDRRNPPYLNQYPGLANITTGDTQVLRQALAADMGFGNGMSGGGGSAYNIDRFNPQKDRLEEGSILEEWIPRQPTQLHMMFRKIYLRDAIAGSVVDIFSSLPWGKVYELMGIDDPKVLQMFQDMLEAIQIWGELPMISREVQVIGRNISNLVFNERLGHWDSLIPIDPDQCKLKLAPVNAKPHVDVLSSPAWRDFARSVDPRDIELKEQMNPAAIEMLQNHSGFFPLDPLNTLFVARRVNQYDKIGTSIFTRILPAWAYEMALWNASLTGVRRRNRSILLVTAGIEENWEPTDDEIQSLSSIFMQADEDPTGGVVAVRQGVEVSEVRDPTSIWGISQEFEFLSTIKMRALGVSEAYLSGDTNVSNMETARTTLGKSVGAFRDFMIRSIFTDQLFPTFARIHNIQKRTQAELSHGIRTTGMTRVTAKAAMDIPRDALMMPMLVTEDTLRPEQDTAYLEMLEKLGEKGVPVPLRIWASAAGYDLDKAMAMMADDALLKKRLGQLGVQGGGGGMGGGMGADLGGGGTEEIPTGPAPTDEGKASNRSGGPTLPPRWGANARSTEGTLERNLNKVVPIVGNITPQIYAELKIPNSRALVPYSGK